MTITIRETTDAALLAELNRQVQELHRELYPGIFRPFDQQAIAGWFAELFEQRECKAFLAMDGETVLGYVLAIATELPENAFRYARRFLALDQVLVLEQHRGKGAGKLLLEQVIACARDLGLKRIELDHWTDNVSAREFFNRQGFSYCRESMCLDL